MSEPAKEIVKVSRPITPADGDFLVYAEGRSRMKAVSARRLPDYVHAAFGTDITARPYKVFFYATWDADRHAWDILDETAPDQTW